MPASSDQLELEIGALRNELAHTLDELRTRASPVAIARRNRARLVIGGVTIAMFMVAVAIVRRH